MAPTVPTERLVIEWPAGVDFNQFSEDEFNSSALERIRARAAELIVRGERPWMEVWYVGVPGRPDSTADDFDAVEVDADGNVITLPPYSELEAAGA